MVRFIYPQESPLLLLALYYFVRGCALRVTRARRRLRRTAITSARVSRGFRVNTYIIPFVSGSRSHHFGRGTVVANAPFNGDQGIERHGKQRRRLACRRSSPSRPSRGDNARQMWATRSCHAQTPDNPRVQAGSLQELRRRTDSGPFRRGGSYDHRAVDRRPPGLAGGSGILRRGRKVRGEHRRDGSPHGEGH